MNCKNLAFNGHCKLYDHKHYWQRPTGCDTFGVCLVIQDSRDPQLFCTHYVTEDDETQPEEEN